MSENKECSWIVSDNACGGGEENIRGCRLKPYKEIGGIWFCKRHSKQVIEMVKKEGY